MKIGIFSDIHGNNYAFQKVIERLKKESCDAYIFAGDICGYYYGQNEVIGILKSMKNVYGVMGNHDRIFIDMIDNNADNDLYEERYVKSNMILRPNIKKENIEYLRDLPLKCEIKNIGIFVCHGSPFDLLEDHVYPDSLLTRFATLKYKYIILGHTHYPMDRNMGNVRIINPGSAGQPRDYSIPSCAILETETSSLEYFRIDYDKRPLINEIERHKEKNGYLIEILKRKKHEK